MRISDWSSDVCSSDLGVSRARPGVAAGDGAAGARPGRAGGAWHGEPGAGRGAGDAGGVADQHRRWVRCTDRKSVVKGKSVSGRVGLGVLRIIQKNNTTKHTTCYYTTH